MKKIVFLLLLCFASFAGYSQSYCTPSFGYAYGACNYYGMHIGLVKVNGESSTSINDAASCNGSGYLDQTSLSCTLYMGNTYSMTVNTPGGYSMSGQVWIDFNYDGTFDASERVGGYASGSGNHIFNITLPGSVYPTAVRMRVATNDANYGGAHDPSINPCGGYYYGEDRDYTINVATPPPTASLTPSTRAFGAVLAGATSGTLNTVLSASYLSTSTGNLTVTAPTNFEVYNGSAWVSSYTISFSGAGVSAATIPIHFVAPATTGSYSGSVCVTGGGLSSAVCASVSGTSAAVCSGTPTAGTGSVSPTTGSTGTTFTLSTTGFTSAGSITFQWQSSATSGGTYTNITGATTSSYSFSGMTASTYFRCLVTCTASSLSATTTPVLATWAIPASSCTPAFANACSSFPMTSAIRTLVGAVGTISDATACTSASYEDYSSTLTCTLYQSLSYNATLNVASSYYASFHDQVWIDFNDNGSFESSESVGGVAYPSSPSPVISLAIPATAAIGLHRMRIVGNYQCCGNSSYPTMNPCPTTSTSYGDCRDYSVTIAAPPPMANLSPTTLNFGTIGTSSTSAAQSTVLNASFLSGATGTLTVTASTNYEVCATAGGTYTSSYTISYSSSTVTANSVYVHFVAPGTPGTYTGTVCVSGGGLSTAVCASLTGISANACAGTPTPGTASVSPLAGTSATTFNFSLSGTSIGLGLSYQWQSATTSGGTYTNVSGATNATYSVSGLTSARFYKCVVSCSYSGLNAASNAVGVAVYCFPAFAQPCSSYPMSAAIGTLNGSAGTISDVGTTCTSGGYEDMTALSCSVIAGNTYTASMSLSSSYYSSFSVQFWIDYNDDGTFASSESIGGGGSFGSSTPNVTLTLPLTATVGTHRMRLVNNYNCCGGGTYPSISPCPTTSISYGDARDYTINILPPPPAATLTPASIAFSPTTTGSSSATSNLTLNASYLTPAASNLTVVSSNSNFEVYDGSAWVLSYTIAYTAATVSAGTIPVRFTPSGTGSFSGTICVSGGGLSSAVCSSVTGTGATACSGTPSAGTAAVTPTTGSTGTTFTLNCTGYTSAGGITFQWQSASTSGGTYANISGATLSSYSFSGLTATTYYKCIVTCSISGLSATTAYTTATWVLPSSSCTPAFANPCSSFPMNASIGRLVGGSGSITDVSGCTSSSYEDFSASLSCTLYRSLSYTVTENLTTSYYNSFTTQMWIDFNDNGTFESTESMGGLNFPSTPTPTFSITVPSGAAIGLHRARFVGNYGCCGYSSYPSINPCPTSAISYGDVRDYAINVQDPPPYGSTTPTSLNFSTIATSSTSSTLSTVLSAFYLTPATGTVTVTAPANYQVCSTAGGTYGTSYTISYSASTITANTIYVQFVAPSTPGVYSGNVTVTGGGLGAAINTAVTGIGANPCSGTPSGGTALVSPAAGTSATTFNLSLSGATVIGLGLSYQWQSATSSGGTYTNITGATNTTYSVSGLTSARWFRCVVSCSYSGLSATSSNVGCAVYCLPAFGQPCSSYPMSAAIGTLNGVSGTISDVGTTCTSASYEDMTALSCTLTAGVTYTATMSLSSSYYSNFSLQFWIDYNDDGTFATSESVGGGGSFSSTTPNVSLVIPTTATVGVHRMRLVNNYQCCGNGTYPTINPCPTTSISYGDARDYTINIAPPPPAATLTPSTIAFSPATVGTPSATSYLTLTAAYLTPAASSLTVTSSNAAFEVYNGSAWVSTYTIAYTAATVSATSIPVRFNPGSTGSFSGTICVTGGGLSSAVCSSVNGTGATICSGTPTAGTAAVSPTSGSTGTTFTLSCTGYSASGGIGFQWQSASTSGGTYTDITGATLASYSFSGLTATTYYKCVVTCSASGLSATTAYTTATWVLAASSCTPTFANPCSSYPMNTSIKNLVGASGSIVDNNACTSSSYIDYSGSIGCTLYRSTSYTVTENVSTTYYSSFTTQFWIDFNDNGTFETTESLGGSSYGTITTPTPTFSISIPSGAALGMHRARIVGNYGCCGYSAYPSVNPCPTASISYGDCRDYYVIIQNPAPLATATPASLSFGTIPASTSSTAQATVVTGSFLTPASDALTVTAPTNFSVCSTSGGTYVPSYAISYSAATVAATSVFVKFDAPATTGAYSGNVVLSGGGLTPLNIPVTGTSANACSGTPTAGTTVTTPSAGTSSTSFTLSLSGSSIGLGLTYQWSSSATGTGGWTALSGATNATYTFSGLTSSTYYYCLVSCTYSGLNQYSSVGHISNYCVPAFSQPCSSYPMNASIGTLVGVSGTISDATACTSSSYEDMTSLSCSLTAGVTYTPTLNLSCSYYSSFSVQVWIDYNDDGTFASSESVGGGSSFSSCTSSTISLAIPSSATVGVHRMRLVNNYNCCGGGTYPSISPCPTTSISYGDARDYTINILPPPPAATLTPSSIAFSPTTTGTSSSSSALILNASYLTPAASNLTVTSSSSAFEVYSGSAWVSSYTIAYTGATVSAGTILVRFSPASAGSFSGTICVSGGGLASAVCSSVNGTGASPCSGTPTPGTAAVSPTTGSGGTTFTLTCSGYSASGGIGFQWQSSAAGSGSWSNITGATLAVYSFTGISVSTDYRCIVSCSYSGLTANTGTTTATWTLPPSSCTPTFGSASAACSSYNMYAQFAVVGTSGSIADASACSGSGWEDLTASTSVTFLRGNTFTSTITTGSTYYSSMTSQVWIDYNDNGTFASSESVGGYNFFTAPAQPVTLTIPSGATPGIHRMRVVVNYACCGYSSYPSMDPCPTSAITYGDVRDYKVNVIAPVACSGTPTAGAVSASPTSGCSPVSTSMYPTAAVGVTGLTYQWQSSATSGGTYTAISGATNFTYAPSVSTSTYYNCVLTCTASGGSATSSNQLITANPTGGAFSGTPNACSGSTSTLSNAVSGGTWSSSNTAIATVNSTTGVVTGGAPGSCSILYTTSGCSAVSQAWTTNANPGTISGTANACVGSTSTLSNTVPGGTWTSSDTTIGRVVSASSTTGTVTAMSAGTCTITYSTGCGTPATTTWTTNSTPSAIIGLSSVCTASVNNFSNTVSGGTWSVSGSATGTTIDATTGDLYTATTVGTETVTYAIGSCSVTMTVAVGSSGPSTITGATSVCATATTTLSDAITGGAWTSSNPSIASIGFSTGVVTGVGGGTVTITYSTGCGSPVTSSMTVNGSPVSISSATACSGNTLSLTASTVGSGSFTYSWSGPLGFTSTIANPTIGSATTARSGIYSVSVTQAGCTTSTSYWASVDTTPVVSVTASPASICPGGTSNLSVSVTSPASGSTAYTVMAIPYAPYTLSTSTAGPSGDDAASSATIPFSFNYYGTSYSSVSICTNGYICIGGSSTSYTPYALPSTSSPLGMVALFMHDLNGSGITYGTVGSTPNRKFVINYNDYNDYSGSGTNRGQIVLYETSNVIEMFISKSNTASSYTQICGIQNPAGSLATTVSGQNNTNYTINNTVAGTAWRFERPVYSYTWSPATGLSATNIANPVSSGLSSTLVYSVTSIDANSGCTTGNVSPNTVNVYTPPTAYTVSPATGCTSGTNITLPGSETTATYQLYNGASPVGSPITGTGSSISFGTITATGTYTIVATLITGGCQTTMTGSCIIYNSPNAYAMTGGSGCSYSGVTIGLAGSDAGVTYQLYLGASTVGSPVSGTGSAISFGTVYGAGSYSVIGTATTGGCQTTMTGSSTIAISPVAYTVTGGNGCTATGVAVGTSNSETGVSYQMYLNGSTSGSPVTGSTGTGVTFGTQYTTGAYTIIASAGGCDVLQTGADTVNTTPSITLGANPSLCQPATSANISFSSATGSPTTYDITWGSAAITDGFSNVTGGTLSGSSIVLAIPSTSIAGAYTGTITVSNGPCSSTSYGFTLTVYAVPAGSITSAVPPCSGYSTSIVFTGTSGATVSYQINHGSIINATLTGGTYTLSTGALTAATTYTLYDVHNPVCSDSINIDTVITPNPMTWIGGTTGSESEWNTTTNWSCGFIPTAADNVTIPSGTTYSPVIAASASGTSNNITIAAGATVTIGAGGNLNVKGNMTHAGTITGAGSVVLNSASGSQSISGIGTVNNFELNNPSGASVSVASRFTIKGLVTITAGALATGDSVVFYSDSFGTARLAPIPGSGSSITGNVKVMQWIPTGRRAYRFWGHPFSNYIGLDQVQNYIDVTGAGGASNGFTTTASNAPSAFRYNPLVGNSAAASDPGWRPFTSAYTTADSNRIHQYQGLRLYFRGAKGEGLGYAAYVPSSTTVAQWGVLNQGTQTVVLAKGSAANQEYNMVGNPYASPVDIGTSVYNAKVAGALTGVAYYVWNPFLGSVGQFQAQTIPSGTAVPYYLQGSACFQVRAAYNAATMTFTESMKNATATTNVLKASPDYVALTIYDANYHPWDMLNIKFNDDATNEEDANYDATKPSSPADLNFYSLSADNKKLSIDGRPYQAESAIPLGIQSSVAQDFIIKAENVAVPEGGKVYLHDKLLKQYVLLQQGTEYRFSISSDKQTQGEQRFELSMAPSTVANNKGLHVTMTPNPATDEVTIGFTNGKAESVSVRVLDLSGVSIYNQNLGTKQNGSINVQLSNFAAGIYMVELTSGDQKVVQRLIKE